MKTVPAMLGLTDFSAEAVGYPPLSEAIVPPVPAHETEETEQQFISQQQLDQAVAQARAEVEARYEQQLQKLREDGERQLEEERLRATENQADQLAGAVIEQFAALGPDLAERLFERCRPVLARLARDQAVGELSDVLTSIVQANCTVVASGPDALLKALRDRLEGHPLDVVWTEAPGADISIEAGDTIVETQLSDWFCAVEETADG
ncbi:MAG: hypothetical protein HKN11_20495 [Rhizobiales bacterium]|nr:hypothetical protein [Hyphomicrobiales bacterium]